MVLPQKALKRIHRQTGVLPRLGRTFFVLHTTTEGKEQFARVTYLRFLTPSAARTAETALANGSHGNAGAGYQGLRRRGTAVIAIEADPASVARAVSEHIRFETIPTEKTAWLQQATAKEQAILQYLETQACEASPNIAQQLPEARLYLTGESHGMRANSEIRQQMLRSLHQHRAVRALLMEMPYSTAAMLQEYLDSGDARILNSVFARVQGTAAYTKEKKQFWRSLQEWNAHLDPDDRIRVYGIDIEHQLSNSTAYLYHLFRTHSHTEPSHTLGWPALKELQNKIYEDHELSYGAVETDEWKRLIRRALMELRDQPHAVAGWFGEDRLGLQLVLQNILYRYECVEGRTSDRSWNRLRDERIYRNFLALYPSLPKEIRCFGQWGLNHVFQAEEFGVRWCATRLQHHRESPLRGEVCSIALIYEQANERSKHNQITTGFSTYLPESGAFHHAARWEQTLYSLDEEGSPFRSELIWTLTTPRPEMGVTTDFFQYAIYLRFSPASRGLNQRFY
jgi:hypothetical protein